MRFKDNYRQLAFEVLQGVKIVEDENSSNNLSSKNSSSNLNQLTNQKQDETSTMVLYSNSSEEITQSEREENVRQLVADCRKQLVDDNEDCYGSWALINYTE